VLYALGIGVVIGVAGTCPGAADPTGHGVGRRHGGQDDGEDHDDGDGREREDAGPERGEERAPSNGSFYEVERQRRRCRWWGSPGLRRGARG
jgi:hypothetical protein